MSDNGNLERSNMGDEEVHQILEDYLRTTAESIQQLESWVMSSTDELESLERRLEGIRDHSTEMEQFLGHDLMEEVLLNYANRRNSENIDGSIPTHALAGTRNDNYVSPENFGDSMDNHHPPWQPLLQPGLSPSQRASSQAHYHAPSSSSSPHSGGTSNHQQEGFGSHYVDDSRSDTSSGENVYSNFRILRETYVDYKHLKSAQKDMYLLLNEAPTDPALHRRWIADTLVTFC
ncbi:uncharacterized protein [Bemisia tabaci]|uniref:uncharacterized protein n=1 Tax=Bemisia tabaci TaxID=7038 RepID=UPI003B282CC0